MQTIAEDKLLIEWAGIPADQITNTLASYKVEYWKMEDPSIKATTTVLSATSTEISSLEIYTVYCHQVYGVLTSGISGNRSEVVCNSTDESGDNKFNLVYLLFYLGKSCYYFLKLYY